MNPLIRARQGESIAAPIPFIEKDVPVELPERITLDQTAAISEALVIKLGRNRARAAVGVSERAFDNWRLKKHLPKVKAEKKLLKAGADYLGGKRLTRLLDGADVPVKSLSRATVAVIANELLSLTYRAALARAIGVSPTMITGWCNQSVGTSSHTLSQLLIFAHRRLGHTRVDEIIANDR